MVLRGREKKGAGRVQGGLHNGAPLQRHLQVMGGSRKETDRGSGQGCVFHSFLRWHISQWKKVRQPGGLTEMCLVRSALHQTNSWWSHTHANSSPSLFCLFQKANKLRHSQELFGTVLFVTELPLCHLTSVTFDLTTWSSDFNRQSTCQFGQ